MVPSQPRGAVDPGEMKYQIAGQFLLTEGHPVDGRGNEQDLQKRHPRPILGLWMLWIKVQYSQIVCAQLLPLAGCGPL